MANVKISDIATTETALSNVAYLEGERTSGNTPVKIPVALITPALTLITETVTTGSASSVTFSSIPSTYRDLVLRIRGRGTTAATEIDIRMQFNGDTASNYDFQNTFLYNALTATVGHAVASIRLGNISAASATSGVAGVLEALIGDYRGTTFNKSVFCESYWRPGTGVSDGTSFVGGGMWRSTSAITSLVVFPSAGAFVDGTVVSLYGSL